MSVNVNIVKKQHNIPAQHLHNVMPRVTDAQSGPAM